MSESLQQTIEQARAQHMDDAAIKQLLVGAGWQAGVVDAALKGIFVPEAPAAATPATPAATPPSAIPSAAGPASILSPAKPTLSSLEAALHHILLWFFTGSTAATLGMLVATLYGYNSSAQTIAGFLATSLITVLAYGVFYGRYLRRIGREPAVIAGRTWSIITIVLHSVVVMGALITFVTQLINAGTEATAPVLTGAAAIATLDGLVILAYVAATFMDPVKAVRRLILRLYPVLVLVLVGSFAIAGLLKLGPLEADEAVRKDLVKATEQVRNATERANNRLPERADNLDLPASVSYKRLSGSVYELCADFKTTTRSDQYTETYGDNGVPDLTDGYAVTYNFSNKSAGRQCFKVTSQSAQDLNTLPADPTETYEGVIDDQTMPVSAGRLYDDNATDSNANLGESLLFAN